MYPLRFVPLFRRYIWGGQRLGDVLNKPIGSESCAESWEIVDHHEAQSVVSFGEFQGTSLAELIDRFGSELLGESVYGQISSEHLPQSLRRRFPLLLKFLDANRALSVQVHPNDDYGATLDPPDLGKTEAWYVMHAEPGAKIYAGLKEGITAEKLRSAIRHGFTKETLHSFEPKAGDCVFIRAGTMHAIGEGLLIAEIQQCSNTTFRVFDWNRVDENGQPRPLHIDQAIEVADFELGPVNAQPPSPTEFHECVVLIDCEKFTMRRWTLSQPNELMHVGGDGRFRILAVTQGSVVVENDPSQDALKLGETMLLPAALDRTAISSNSESELLEIFISN